MAFSDLFKEKPDKVDEAMDTLTEDVQKAKTTAETASKDVAEIKTAISGLTQKLAELSGADVQKSIITAVKEATDRQKEYLDGELSKFDQKFLKDAHASESPTETVQKSASNPLESEAYAKAMLKWILKQDKAELNVQKAALDRVTATGMAEWMPSMWEPALLKDPANWIYVVRAGCRVIQSSGVHKRNIRLFTNGAPMQLTAEGAAFPEINPTSGDKVIEGYKYSGHIKWTDEAAEDVDFNLEDEVRYSLQNSLPPAVNPAFATGTGVNQPQGIVTGATAATAGAWGYDYFVKLMHSIFTSNPELRDQCVWMMNDAVLAEVKLIKDTTNMPIFTDARDGSTFILGKPVKINNSMTASIVAGQIPVLFGYMPAFRVYEWNGGRTVMEYNPAQRLNGINILQMYRRYTSVLPQATWIYKKATA